jgi:MFS family permease
VTWALTGYLLAAAVATPVLGRLADVHGKRRVLLAALAVSLVGAAIAAGWHSTTGLITGRVLQGGLTAVYPLTLSIVRDQMPAHRLRPAVGTVSAMFGAGGGAGLIVASLVAGFSSGYQVAFVGLTVLLVAGIALVAAVVRESPARARARVDVAGAGLLAIWLAAVLLGVTEGNSWGWLGAPTLALFALAATGAVGWWVVESRTAAPLVDTEVFARPAVLIANVGQVLGGFTSFLAFIEISDWAQTPSASGYGFSASVLGASVFLLPWTVASVVARPLAVWLLRAIDLDGVLAGGAVVVAASFAFLGVSHGAAADLYLASAGAGLGIGLLAVVIPILVVEGAPQAQMGVATSMNIIARNVGGAVGASAVGALLVAAGTGPGGYPRVGGYVAGFLAGSASCLVLAVVVAARHLRHGAPVAFVPVSAATSALVESDTPSPLG